MTSPSSLNGSHRHTYEALLRHPAPHNLAWHDVRALLATVGSVFEQPNGHLKVTRRGHSLTLHAPRAKELSEPAVLGELRRFLEQSENSPVPAAGAHWLVVIDHHVARLYRSTMQGAVPQQILPHTTHGHTPQTQNTLDFSRGRQKPDPASYFGAVATALGDEGKVLVFGTGKGTSSEMDLFLTWVTRNQPALTARIIGAQVVDENHLTEGQLLALARQFYAQVPETRLK